MSNIILAVIFFMVFIFWCLWSGRNIGPSMMWINAALGWLLGQFVIGPLLAGVIL